MERVSEKLIRNEHFKGFSDRSWCRFALHNAQWPLWQDIKVTLDTPESFNDARDTVERMLRDGWTYDGCNGDGDLFLIFSKKIPVTDEERAQAKEWLEKHGYV
jgi:uncharacterized protein YggL (DUF469 family)